LQKPKVAFYGLTTEGYLLASRIIEKASVTIIDETLQMAMDLQRESVRAHPTVGALVGDEALIGLKPISQVLSEAAVVFFTPKLKKRADESVIESSGKLRDVAKSMNKGSILVNTLPTGVGGNSDNISMLEKQTGLKVGETFGYVYAPLRARQGEPSFMGGVSPKGSEAMDDLGIKKTHDNLATCELAYVSAVLSENIQVATQIELMKKARENKANGGNPGTERFLDDLSSHLYDLAAIQASEDVGEPITYLSSAVIKSLDNYERYIVDETRDILRELQLKASRTKVLLVWTLDRYEMRADRSHVAEDLVSRLRDYVTDVEHIQSTHEDTGAQVLNPYRHNLAIVCSKTDHEWVKTIKKASRGSEVSLLKATPGLERE
jgi:UDP-N-acetyl-D-mannosaminuronate dehydrogenase